MNRGTPNWKDVSTPVGNHLVYPRRVMIQILQSAFAEPHLYTPDDENPFLFKLDPETGEVAKDSKLVIADNYSDELEQTDPRPMIIVTRGDLTDTDLGIGAQINSTGWGGAPKKYSTMTDSSLNLNCIGRRDLESEELAWVVFLFVKMLKAELRRQVNMFVLGNPRVGSVAAVKADSQIDLFLTPVSMSIQQSVTWNVTKPTAIPKIIAQFFLKNHTDEEPFVEVSNYGHDQEPQT